MSDRVTCGVNMDDSAWVRCGPSVYHVTRREEKATYAPADYDVALESGPDALPHDEVRLAAHDAFLDAFGPAS